MSPPDTTVLSQSLTTITSQVLAHNEEAKFRNFMLRAMLKMDAQPTATAVLEYRKHLLAECEALAVSKPAEATKPGVRFGYSQQFSRWEGRWPSRKASLQVLSRCFGMQAGW